MGLGRCFWSTDLGPLGETWPCMLGDYQIGDCFYTSPLKFPRSSTTIAHVHGSTGQDTTHSSAVLMTTQHQGTLGAKIK